MDERAEQIQREFAVMTSQEVSKDKGGIPPVAAAATRQDGQPEAVVAQATEQKDEITVPKWRFDEINAKYQDLRSNPPIARTEEPTVASSPQLDLDKLVESKLDSKLAPIRVRMEIDQVLKDHPDFSEVAPRVMERIKTKPALSLEEAYQLEKFSLLESKAKEEGKQEAYQIIEKKASLSTEHSGRKTVTKSPEELIHDKSIPLSEIARMLPHE